jgi:hypothetical protein
VDGAGVGFWPKYAEMDTQPCRRRAVALQAQWWPPPTHHVGTQGHTAVQGCVQVLRLKGQDWGVAGGGLGRAAGSASVHVGKLTARMWLSVCGCACVRVCVCVSWT